METPLLEKNYCSKGIHFAAAKFHCNEHNFFCTRTKRKSYTNVTDFVRTFKKFEQKMLKLVASFFWYYFTNLFILILQILCG